MTRRMLSSYGDFMKLTLSQKLSINREMDLVPKDKLILLNNKELSNTIFSAAIEQDKLNSLNEKVNKFYLLQ